LFYYFYFLCRDPQLIFNHFHFLLSCPDYMEEFLSIIHAQAIENLFLPFPICADVWGLEIWLSYGTQFLFVKWLGYFSLTFTTCIAQFFFDVSAIWEQTTMVLWKLTNPKLLEPACRRWTSFCCQDWQRLVSWWWW
jgi:hypothetical protein